LTSLVEKIVGCHESLAGAGLPHAFGGALAGVFAPLESVRGEPAMPPQPITEQVRDRVEGHMAHAEKRRGRLDGRAR